MRLKYSSGEDIQPKDRVTYHGERGEVEFVVTDPTGNAAMDWYLEQFPGGGCMVTTEQLGHVFVVVSDGGTDLEFLGRGS